MDCVGHFLEAKGDGGARADQFVNYAGGGMRDGRNRDCSE
jgi:hypothetical protein